MATVQAVREQEKTVSVSLSKKRSYQYFDAKWGERSKMQEIFHRRDGERLKPKD